MDPEVSKALADLKATNNSVFLDRQRSEEEYKDLIKAAEKAKLIQHKAAIKATKLEHKSSSSKRAVSAYLKLYCRDPACSSANAPNTRILCILGICS